MKARVLAGTALLLLLTAAPSFAHPRVQVHVWLGGSPSPYYSTYGTPYPYSNGQCTSGYSYGYPNRPPYSGDYGGYYSGYNTSPYTYPAYNSNYYYYGNPNRQYWHRQQEWWEHHRRDRDDDD